MARITYRKAQQILKARRSARRPHSLTSHAIRCGLAVEDAKGVANGLRTQAKKQGLTGRTALVGRTVEGRCKGRKRRVVRYTTHQVVCALRTYRPRKATYVAARERMIQELAK